MNWRKFAADVLVVYDEGFLKRRTEVELINFRGFLMNKPSSTKCSGSKTLDLARSSALDRLQAQNFSSAA